MFSKVWTGVVPFRFILLISTNVVKIQDTKVLESQEIRTKMCLVRKRTPAKEAKARIIKYDGNQREPRWMDIEQGVTLVPW